MQDFLHRWQRSLEQRLTRSFWLVEAGMPDPAFTTLADEIAAFRLTVQRIRDGFYGGDDDGQAQGG